jgi:hypothetical protein
VSPDGARVAFELDRFELTGDDRLEIAGRWFGVRGLRFVRPSLILQTEEGERSLLAVLEHKPWAAVEGESWTAAFPWKGDSPDPGQAELAVAPSVVVALSGAAERSEKKPPTKDGRKPTLRERLDEEAKRARRLDNEVAWLREEREALLADKRSAEAERAKAADELADVRRELEAAAAERGKAERERDAAVASRDEAARERDRAAAARDEAISERDVALAAREQALAELEGALRDREAAVRQREHAAQEREELVAERDEAVAAKISAFAERDAALGRGSGFPAVSAAELGRQPYAPNARPSDSGAPQDWGARAVALGGLVTLLLLVIVLLKVL